VRKAKKKKEERREKREGSGEGGPLAKSSRFGLVHTYW